MEILHTVHIFLPHVGGSEYAVYWLSRSLAARGHRVTVATSAMGGGLSREIMDGIRVLRFADTAAYQQFVIDGDFDVRMLFGYNVWSTDDLAPRINEMPRPWIFVPCGRIAETDRLRQILEAEPDAIVRLTSREDRGIHIPLGVSLSEFKTAVPGFKEKYQVGNGAMALHVGGYWSNKRIPELVGVLRGAGEVTLVCVGNGHLSEFSCLAGPNVKILGSVGRPDILSAYLECDVVVSASSFEGFGLYMLEAMAAGKPWISTDVGAARELPGGIVVKHPDQIFGAVREILSSPRLYQELVDEGQEALRVYDWPVIAGRFEQVYESCLEGRESA